jgi:hypothetical protein
MSDEDNDNGSEDNETQFDENGVAIQDGTGEKPAPRKKASGTRRTTTTATKKED